VDDVPSHEGIQDDVDATPFRESDETLVETTSYLVKLDKYARRLEDKSRNLFGEIRDAIVEARQYHSRCLKLERENNALCHRVRQFEHGLNHATTILLQSEREHVDTREELLHIREDLRRMTTSQNRLKDRFQSKDDMLTVRAHLLGCERIKVEKLEKNRVENVANLVWLTRTTVYLRDKAERLRRTSEDADSLRVDELMELNGELPFESQCAIRTETFELHQSRLKLHLGYRPASRLKRFEGHTPWCPGSFRRTTPLRTDTLSRTRGLAPSRVQSEGMT
jgi:hypothetical protein